VPSHEACRARNSGNKRTRNELWPTASTYGAARVRRGGEDLSRPEVTKRVSIAGQF
jgi:hypothetical protein